MITSQIAEVRSMKLLIGLVMAATLPAQEAGVAIRWRDARELLVEGQGWRETKQAFDRLPARAEGLVRKEVWDLAHDSAGVAVRFVTDAPTIRARWTLKSEKLAMPHMPATGVSGLDLYVRLPGGWRWVANGRPEKQANEQTLLANWPGGRREYMLYLPLYNGVMSVEVGVPEGANLEAAAVGAKPVVVYGSSIAQGGCASRPGMAYPAILGRRLDRPVINLGFSGNGKSEPELAELLNEIEASVYVYDSLPNLSSVEAWERVEPFVRKLRYAHPETPVVLVENAVYANAQFVEQRRTIAAEKNVVLRGVYEKLRKEGDRRVFYVRGGELYGDDGEATVDGVHPTDVGFMRMAEAIGPVVRRALRAR
ncbi:MAG: SGNH/GDSL hydrolase family protein [Candidatus Solibacter usitatus]|nr:SGNH/GDSL hydrolase family protein [Candidatus Solibacter usitatus]